MNIAVILPSLKNKAPIQVAKDIVDELLKKSCNVDVFYFESVVEIDFNCPSFHIKLYQKINFKKYDVIHSHMLRSDFYVWLHRGDIPSYCISTLHNEIDKVLKNDFNVVLSKIFTRLWVLFLKSHDEIICLSKYAKDQLKHNYGFKKVDYIYNGRSISYGNLNKVDLDIIEKKRSKYKILGVVANVSKIKGIHQIIYSLTELDDYCLMVIGDGVERKRLENLVKKLNLEERCTFLGYRNNGHHFLKYFDIYLMTSYSEGFPLALLEAAQSKKVTICSNIPLFREIFSMDEAVFFELDNKKSLIEAIKNAEIRKDELSENIYAAYMKNFTLTKMGENYFKKIMTIKNK
ncbi:MAG: glycosyltransferase family 4 protein [Spirosomataceae bacterium]